jgi:hypothetical protein
LVGARLQLPCHLADQRGIGPPFAHGSPPLPHHVGRHARHGMGQRHRHLAVDEVFADALCCLARTRDTLQIGHVVADLVDGADRRPETGQGRAQRLPSAAKHARALKEGAFRGAGLQLVGQH